MSTTVIALAEELCGAGGGPDHGEAMRIVTSYANQLDVETGVQSGGIAPYAELTDEQAEHIRGMYLMTTIHTGPTERHDMTTYTAWLTTTYGELEGDLCDVSVLANDDNGASTGDPLYRAETTTRHDGDHDGLHEEVRVMLLSAGWTTHGTWEQVPTGSVITVTQD